MGTRLRVRPGKLKLASILGIPNRPVKLYEKLETANTPVKTPPLPSPFRLIGGFSTHKFLFVFDIPPSSAIDLFQFSPAQVLDSPFVYDFGSQVGVEYDFPMKFVLYRIGSSTSLHFRSVLNNEKGVERVVPILRDIKNSTLSVAVIDDTGKVLQPEKLACCQRGSKGGLCFRVKDFITVTAPASRSLLTSSGTMILRIQFVGYNLSPQGQPDAGEKYVLDTKFRNLLYQLVRDEEYNSFLRSWASNTKFANVKLRIQDKSQNVTVIPAHRVLLAAQSDALGGYLRPREEVIVLEGYSHFSLLVMLDFIYSGEIHCNDFSTLVNLAQIGDRLLVYGLKDKCVRDIVMMFDNCVTNVKHIVACFKLGMILNSACLQNKAAESFRVMKLCDKCIDFPYSKALMAVAGTENDEEFNQILNSLYEKSGLSKETVRHLVQFPADEVKLLGTSSETWTGYAYVIAADACAKLTQATEPEFSLVQNFEIEEGFFEMKRSPTGEITLTVTSATDAQDSGKHDEDLDNMLQSLGITRSDYLSVIADSIGMTLKVSLFDVDGRIITASLTRGVLDGNRYLWEVTPFITPSTVSNFGETDLILRISFGATQLHPTVRSIPATDDRHASFKKYDTTFLKKVNAELFTTRLLTQLEQGADSDASLALVNDRRLNILKAPAHAVVLSALSSHFEKKLSSSPKHEVEVGNYSLEGIQTLLKFIYGEDISPGHIGLVLELISAAEEFDIKGLRDKCIDKLCSCQLNLETSIHLYEIGSGTNSAPLKDISIKFFRRNRSAVEKFTEFQDLLGRHPEILNKLNS